MRVCGLDLSLRNSGICVLGEGMLVLASVGSEIDRSNKALDIARETLERMLDIRRYILDICSDYEVSHVSIENYAFGSFGKSSSVAQLAELNGIVKVSLYTEAKLVANTVSVRSARKIALGKGHSKKDKAHEVLADKGMRFDNGDEADAFVIAAAKYIELAGVSTDEFWERRIWKQED